MLFFTILLSLFIGIKNSALCAQFSEISFKNTENDWIEIELKNPLTNSLKVQEDSLIFEISPEDMMNKKFILIFFKAQKAKFLEEGKILKVFVTKKGLTGTTEQLTLESAGEILDKVCWKNSKPPASELKDIEKLSIECLNSEEVKKNDSIVKTSKGWQINKKRPQQKQSEKTKNGNLSEHIEITEVFPNPKGKDQGKEWLELHNTGTTSVNLQNWKINKKSIKDLIINPGQYLTINVTLKNTDAQIELKDFNGKIIDHINYTESKEGFSYSKLEKKWYWTNSSKNSANPEIETFEAKIISQIKISDKILKFNVQKFNTKVNNIEPIFIENKEKQQLLKTLLPIGTKIELTVEKSGQHKKMLEFKILETAQKQNPEKQNNYLSIILFVASCATLYYTTKNKRK